MKKLISLAVVLAVILSLGGCGKKNDINTPSDPTPTSVATDAATDEPTQTPEPEKTKAPAPTPDPRDDEDVIRAEIAKMLDDAEELIKEGLLDDAQMVIRDIKTRELNEAETKRLNELQAELVKISD